MTQDSSTTRMQSRDTAVDAIAIVIVAISRFVYCLIVLSQ